MEFGEKLQELRKQKNLTQDELANALFVSRTAQARQNVNHGLISVNGKNVNIPSYQVKVGDIINVREGKEDYAMFKAVKDTKIVTPKWLEFDANTLTGKVLTNPERDDIDLNIKEHLIIEKYSR